MSHKYTSILINTIYIEFMLAKNDTEHRRPCAKQVQTEI